MRVLVVEDEPGVREFITRALMRSGREVVTAVGPLAALTALNNRPAIALMLVDVVMPEMDGYDLAVEARKIVPISAWCSCRALRAMPIATLAAMGSCRSRSPPNR